MRKTLLRALPMLFVGLLVALQGMRAQTNYYVDPVVGNDANAGTVIEAPKRSIQAAVDAAAAGDIVNLANGTYSPVGAVAGYFVNINKSLTIQGASTAGTIINGTVANYITTSNYGLRVAASDVFISDLTVTNFETGIGVGVDAINVFLAHVSASENYRYGFYTNKSVTNLIIRFSTFNNNGNKSGTPVPSSARGIMFQSSTANFETVEVSYNDVSFNQLVGIDFAESAYTNGIKVMENTVSSNGDSGIGMWLGKNDLSSAPTFISKNMITLANNSRFGIEVKNVLASGANSGGGSVVISQNTITQTGVPTDTRDFAAIAVLRRKDIYASINDQPFGAYITGNIISDIKGSALAQGDGFGIVAGGTGHSIIGNTITGTEVAIQLQKGNIGYNNIDGSSPSNPGDANTLYFDRDNSADACAYLSGNNLVANGTDFRMVTDASTSTAAAPTLVASNTTTAVRFCSIQSAIDAPSTLAGNTVNVFPGTNTLTTGISIAKSISLVGNNGDLANKPMITGGDVANKALIYVAAPNVTISNLHLRFQESSFNGATTTTTAGYGIKSGPTGSFNNLTITDNLIEGTNTNYVFNSAAIFLGVLNTNGNDKVTILRNTVGHTVSNNALGRAVRASNINGNIDDNNFKAHYATIQAGDMSGGALIVNNNTLQGKLAMNGYVSPGNKITNNTITSGGNDDANGQTGADRQPALIEVISTTSPGATVEVSGNTLNDFKLLGLAIFYSSNVSVINNTFNPLSGSSNTVGLYFDTKTTNSGTPGAKSFSNLIVKQNTFNTPTPLGTGHVGIKFANSYSDMALAPLTGAVVGGPGTAANIFSDNLTEYIRLDDRPASSTAADPIWSSTYYNSAAVTNILPFSSNIIAEMNVYGTYDTRTDRAMASFLAIKSKIHDKDDVVGLGEVILNLPVRNVNTTEGFVTIQEAIDHPNTLNGHVINVEQRTYTLTSAIVVNKQLTLRGNNLILSDKPIINGSTGPIITVGDRKNALIEIDAPNVKIQNFEFQINQEPTYIGIASTTTDNFNNLEISDNIFKGTKAQTVDGYAWYSHAMRLGRTIVGSVSNNAVNVVRNTITYSNLLAPELFGRGVYAFNTHGLIGGSSANKNNITAVYALQGGSIGDGAGNDFEFSYNDIPVGLVSVVGAKVGNHKLNSNNIGYGIPSLSQAGLMVRMLEVKGSRTANANIEVANNTITNYANIGVFVQRSNNVTIKNNTLTPFAGATAFSSIVFSSKEGTTGAQSPVTSDNLSIMSNTFNGTGGIGISFLNHNGSASVKPVSNVRIGGAEVDKNIFAGSLGTYIFLDGTASGTSTALGALYDVAQDGTNTTNILPFNGDIDASHNMFGGINSGTETDFDNLVGVKAKIVDGVDDGLTGYVNIQPQKAFIGTLATLDNALKTVPDGFTVVLKNDPAIYATLGNRTLANAHTFAIDNNATSEIVFGDVTLAALAKTITFNQPVKAAGNFVVTEGKINAAAGLTLDAAKTINFNLSKPQNFVNGKIKLLNVANGTTTHLMIGKGAVSSAASLIGVIGATSDFELEYFPVSYANVTSFDPLVLGMVHNKEYWTIHRLNGNAQAKVGLTTYDFTNSGFSSFATLDAVVARFDIGGNAWVSAGNDSFSVAGSVGTLGSGLTSDFGVFTFAKTPGVLPVTLVDFTARAASNGALIRWTTSAEQHNLRFEIEKSLDGKAFQVIGGLAGKENATSISNYELVDASFRQSAYYRLAQVDAGGTRVTFEKLTRFVKGLDDGIAVLAYPNPVTTKLFVNLGVSAKEHVKLLLTDMTGKALKSKDADGSQVMELDVAEVGPGSYILQVIKGSGNVSKKIVKL
ncbi:T9SS type A sorting domain-containing protein [Pedobacter nanyangensis]|uniref:T9SS type A sorting domain-containing protein n=1 Tax=Pedobacter nanyangensis TaxID=1562389 RepID=UPI000DE57465|nr:T9SS type A sorting domain-containing protein [Pedobacter nanyangensis]